jgi:hypothetical protein
VRVTPSSVPLAPGMRDAGDEANGYPDFDPPSFWQRLAGFRHGVRSERKRSREDRDNARGYSVNVKQVILAFVVEFVIIGLILVNQYIQASENHNVSSYSIMSALLFPIALAVVELARVPLAIAVRTQSSWNIQFAALFGVCCAVVVTSASLTQIGHYTFNPRLETVHLKRAAVERIEIEKQGIAEKKAAAKAILDQRIRDWESYANTHRELSTRLTAQSGNSKNCTSTETTNEETLQKRTITSCKPDPAFLALQREVAEVKVKRDEAEAVGRRQLAEVDKFDLRPFDERIGKAEAEYRDAIYQSQLHSYTAMLFRKDPREVSDGEVKTLQWYLIVIPSIAAALSSTLIAMTAVRRRRKRKPEIVPAMSDEAAAYLFGPLVTAIGIEAKRAVDSAVASKADPAVQPAA